MNVYPMSSADDPVFAAIGAHSAALDELDVCADGFDPIEKRLGVVSVWQIKNPDADAAAAMAAFRRASDDEDKKRRAFCESEIASPAGVVAAARWVRAMIDRTELSPEEARQALLTLAGAIDRLAVDGGAGRLAAIAA